MDSNNSLLYEAGMRKGVVRGRTKSNKKNTPLKGGALQQSPQQSPQPSPQPSPGRVDGSTVLGVLDTFVSELIQQQGYSDLIQHPAAVDESHVVGSSRHCSSSSSSSSSFGRCYKMRHACGGQPSKYGELMYDTIDKVQSINSTAVY
jgi:hypothetical protein